MPEFERFTVTTGAEEEAYINEKREAFFSYVLIALGLAKDNPFIQVETRSIGTEHPEGFHPSDDVVHRLVVFDEMLALVMDRRNDSNCHEITFWRNEPSALLLEQIGRVITYNSGNTSI